MKTVKLYGKLRKQCGGQKVFQFDVKTPAEAVKALMANFPKLQKWLIDSEKKGIAFVVKVGKAVIGTEEAEQLHHPWSENDIFTITPVPIGAKWWKVVVGIVIVVAAVVLAPVAAPVLGGLITAGGGSLGVISAGVAAFAATVGAYLVMGGISELLAPPPPSPEDMYGKNNPYNGPDAVRLESFALSGIVNTERQGIPCAIAYGRCFTGSAVLSSGFDVDQK